jgi:hypothetical protein
MGDGHEDATFSKLFADDDVPEVSGDGEPAGTPETDKPQVLELSPDVFALMTARIPEGERSDDNPAGLSRAAREFMQLHDLEWGQPVTVRVGHGRAAYQLDTTPENFGGAYTPPVPENPTGPEAGATLFKLNTEEFDAMRDTVPEWDRGLSNPTGLTPKALEFMTDNHLTPGSPVWVVIDGAEPVQISTRPDDFGTVISDRTRARKLTGK